MKRIVPVIIVMMCGFVIAQEREVIVQAVHDGDPMIIKKAVLDDKTKKILAQFANIVIGFFTIVQNPNDPKNVTTQITEMVNNAVNIVTEAVKKGYLSLEATEEEIEEFAQEMIKRKVIVIK